MSPTYHTYIMRWWSEYPQKSDEWRFVLESPRSGRKQGFTEIEKMLDTVRQEFKYTVAQSDDVADEMRLQGGDKP
jgi:hypothetical protein